MAKDNFSGELIQRRTGLLKDQVRLVKRKDLDRYEIVSIRDKLSYEKGFFVAIRACQLLVQKNDGLILVGIAGPSGAGKTIFTEKILNFMPSVAVISMDNYNDATRVIDGNFDDPRLTDYDTLLKNIHDLKAGKPVEVPIYDFKASMRTGYRTIEVPSSRIVIIEGIYALSEKLRPLLDLRVSVTGGVHFDLVKRVFRDIQRAGQAPQEIIHQISETVYPMYKAFIEPDLQMAHIRIINKFNPFTGFQCPTYILKSRRDVTVDQIKLVMPEEHTETMEQTYDIYLLPPGEDPESCQSYLRMRNRDGKYNLMFEVQGRDRAVVKGVAEQLGLEGSYIPRTYIEQIQLEKIVNEVMAVPDDLRTKLSIDEDLGSSPSDSLSRASSKRVTLRNKNIKSGMSHSYSTRRDKNLYKLTNLAFCGQNFDDGSTEPPPTIESEGAITQLSEQIFTLNDRIDEFASKMDELNSNFSIKRVLSSSQQPEACNGSASTSYLTYDPRNGSALLSSSSSSQLAKETAFMEEILSIARGQRQILHQLENLTNNLHNLGEVFHQTKSVRKSLFVDYERISGSVILTLAIGGVGIFLFRGYVSRI
uniref:CYTH domain-containing protein n=1 Tax=Daucus carota subsp. sativus TaxID=79200 RepID=A0A161ZKP1_DAUCS